MITSGQISINTSGSVWLLAEEMHEAIDSNFDGNQRALNNPLVDDVRGSSGCTDNAMKCFTVKRVFVKIKLSAL